MLLLSSFMLSSKWLTAHPSCRQDVLQISYTMLLHRLCNQVRDDLGSAKWERLKGRNGSLSKIFADLALICKVPFTPKFLQINSPPVFFFFFVFFCKFYGNSLRPQIFFVTPMCGFLFLLGGGLEICFCNFYEINSSQGIFFVLRKFWC